MATLNRAPGRVAGRLPADDLAWNFNDLHAVYDPHEAAVPAHRCNS